MNDILLEAPGHADHLVLQAPVLKAEAHDFLLDSPERRSTQTPFRRALVHDQGDGLTLNFGGDYPGGITLNAVASITPKGQPGGRLAALHGLPALVVHGDISYETAGFELIAGGRTRTTVSLTTEIGALHSLISHLTDRVTALETK